MENKSVKEYLNKIYVNLNKKPFSVNSLAKFLFPTLWEQNRKKAQVESAKIIRAGISSHYNVLDYPSTIVNGLGSINNVTEDTILSLDNTVMFSTVDVLSSPADNKIYNFFKSNAQQTYTLSEVSAKFKTVPVSTVRKSVNRLVIAGILDSKQLSGNRLAYSVKEGTINNVGGAVVRKAVKDKKQIKFMETRTKAEILRELYLKVKTNNFSIMAAAACIYPELFTDSNTRKEAIENAKKIVISAINQFLLLDYKDESTSLKYGGITNISKISIPDLGAMTSLPIFIFKDCNNSALDLLVLNTIKKAKAENEYTHSHLCVALPNKSSSTLNRSLCRLFVTGKIEQTKNKEYRVSDGAEKVILENHNIKVDKSLVNAFNTIQQSNLTLLRKLRFNTKEKEASGLAILYALVDILIDSGECSYLTKKSFKELLSKYRFYTEEQLQYFLDKACEYYIFELVSEAKIGVFRNVYNLYSTVKDKYDEDVLKNIDLQPNTAYTLKDIADRYTSYYVFKNDYSSFPNFTFSSEHTIDKHSLYRFIVNGILEVDPETVNKSVKYYYYKASKEPLKQAEAALDIAVKNTECATKDYHAEEDSFEESLDLDNPTSEENKAEDTLYTFKLTYLGLLTLIEFHRTNPNTFNIDSLKKVLSESTVSSLEKHCVIRKLSGELYTFDIPDKYEQDQKESLSLYTYYGLNDFYYDDEVRCPLYPELVRLVLSDIIIVSQNSTDNTMVFKVNSVEMGFSGNNTTPILNSAAQGNVPLEKVDYVPSENLKYEQQEVKDFYVYCVGCGGEKITDSEYLVLSDLEYRFMITESVIEKAKQDVLLSFLYFLTKHPVFEESKIRFVQLNFSKPHNFNQSIVGNNKGIGYICETEDLTVLFVNEAIPALEKN